jgi:hypothetical protein
MADHDPETRAPEISQGEPVRVFDTRSFHGVEYAMNDHAIFQDDAGWWHIIGIFQEQTRWNREQVQLVHGIAPPPAAGAPLTSLVFEFADPPIALEANEAIGETHLWAPHVVRDGDRYVMFYQSGGPDDEHAGIRAAESRDRLLRTWTRIGDRPLFEDVCVARDPMVLRTGDLWVMYHTRCPAETSQLSGVALRTSDDLVHWSAPIMAFVMQESEPMWNSGYTESPFVFERDGWYYLSVTSYPVAWDCSFLYRSRSPFRFDEPPFARLRAHAPEWIVDPRTGQLYMTHTGPGQGGVWLIPVNGI